FIGNARAVGSPAQLDQSGNDFFELIARQAAEPAPAIGRLERGNAVRAKLVHDGFDGRLRRMFDRGLRRRLTLLPLPVREIDLVTGAAECAREFLIVGPAGAVHRRLPRLLTTSTWQEPSGSTHKASTPSALCSSERMRELSGLLVPTDFTSK